MSNDVRMRYGFQSLALLLSLILVDHPGDKVDVAGEHPGIVTKLFAELQK